MSSATETLYTARVRAPQVFERARDQVTNLEVWRDGVLVAPTVAGSSYSLVSPLGQFLVNAQAITVVGDVARTTVTAVQLPDTETYGEGYTERWKLVMPDGTTRTFTREASLAKFQLSPAITDKDLLSEYKDLLEILGVYAENESLQSWIDEAFVQFLNELYSLGEWPDVIVTRAATRAPLKQRTYWLIFKFLFSKQPNAGRYETLMEKHEALMGKEFARMSYRVDRDQDGLPDGLDRHGSSTVVHLNAAPRRVRRNSTRW